MNKQGGGGGELTNMILRDVTSTISYPPANFWLPLYVLLTFKLLREMCGSRKYPYFAMEGFFNFVLHPQSPQEIPV